MAKRIVAACGVALLLAAAVYGQTTPAAVRRAFEAATIKLNNRCFDSGLPPAAPSAPGRLAMHCMPLTSAIQSAYVIYRDGIRPLALGSDVPLEGAPDWLTSDLYDLDAVAAPDARQEEMRGPMLQALLEERLRLKVRFDTREAPIYALTVARTGHRLTPFVSGSCARLDPNALSAPLQAPPCQFGIRAVPPTSSDLVLDAQGFNLDAFARQLGVSLDRPIVNRTGIDGQFTLHLEFAADQTTPRYVRPNTPPSSKASIFQAMQDQLGLRLEPTRGPRPVLVIESVARPTEN
jgi:uncharacterized protein (TIGR03435 family)